MNPYLFPNPLPVAAIAAWTAANRRGIVDNRRRPEREAQQDRRLSAERVGK